MVLLLTLLVLTAIYAVAILSLAALLRRLRIGGGRSIVLSFLVFGAVSGALAAWVWPLDSAAYANIYAVLLGDQVYAWAIRLVGDPYAANAHATIPWLLRVPQVYVLLSLAVSGLAGALMQWRSGWGTARRHDQH
jgi:hypothetical protein